MNTAEIDGVLSHFFLYFDCIQKQPPEVFYKIRCFYKLCKTHGSVSFLINVETQASILLKKRLWHRCFSVKYVKFLRAPILKSICEWLLLYFLLLTNYKKDKTLDTDKFLKVIPKNYFQFFRHEFPLHLPTVVSPPKISICWYKI